MLLGLKELPDCWDGDERYHAFREGRYPLPNDDVEQQREGIRHEMLKEVIDGKLYLAPIGDRPQKIIDLGTGNLKPGGWLEIQDILPQVSSDDDSIPPAYPVIRFYSMIKPVLRDHYGFDIRVLDTLPALLQDLGYVNVQRKVFHVPIGEWAREKRLRVIGSYMRSVLLDLVGAMAARPLVEAGYEREEIEALAADVAEAMENRRIHAYLPIHFVWAQKPGA
ncbi:hypothetical protein N0V88_003191 [Collariella sp. IMI 366227]|nr:hypothetical protein N0V88_003191 [Collariella sp. IMI 366227]